MEPAVAGVLYAAEHLVEGAVALAKGLYHPTLPLRATLSPITGVSLPRTTGTSVVVVKGRAYIFGGQPALARSNTVFVGQEAESSTALEEGPKQKENDMHIVMLPFAGSEGVTQVDYQAIPARARDGLSAVPSSRSGHSAVALGERIYMFGGTPSPPSNPEDDPDARVWVFDTTYNTWSFLDPAPNSSRPLRRAGHVSVAVEMPEPPKKTPPEGLLGKWQQDADPAAYVPEPPPIDSWGTIFVLGGQVDGKTLHDLWAFDIRSRTWRELPSLDSPGTPNLACVGEKLYAFLPAEGESSAVRVAVLDVAPLWKPAEPSASEEKASLVNEMGSWEVKNVEKHGDTRLPDFSAPASVVDVTTGQGREYLLILGQEAFAEATPTRIWAYQLPPDANSAARVKDEMRKRLREATNWGKVAEVEARVEDDEVSSGLRKATDGEGIAGRREFVAAKGTEIDGATVVLWGGKEGGKVRGDGWLVTVER